MAGKLARHVGCARHCVPKKPHIKLSPSRSGRRVRWTFEVSADVGGENRAAKKPEKKAKKPAKKARKPTLAKPLPPMVSAPSRAAMVAAPEPVEPSPRPAPTPATVPVAAVEPVTPWHFTRGQMVGLAGIFVIVIATMAVPRQLPDETADRPLQPEQRNDVVDVASPLPAVEAAPVPRTSVADARPVVNTPKPPEAVPKKSSVQNVTLRSAPSTRPLPSAALAATDKEPAVEAPAAPPEPIRAVPAPIPVAVAPSATIIGCLEMSMDGNEFRLADTEGADAPKSRSWKSGFFKKRTAPVSLIGVPDPLALKTNVGKRVAATGQLTNRELHLSSFRVVGSSCN